MLIYIIKLDEQFEYIRRELGDELRAAYHSDLVDALEKIDISRTGLRVILPPSFVGGQDIIEMFL